MKADVSIYLAQFGLSDEDRWVCKNNETGWIYAAYRTYQQAVSWCERNGYSHD